MLSHHRTDTTHRTNCLSIHPIGATGCAATSRQHRTAAETRDVAITSAGFAADLLPPDWTAHAAPVPDGSIYLLILTPPAGTAQAHLVAPHAGCGWAIGITDPADGTDTVLRTAGGDIAYQATLADAVHAARTALHAETRPTPDINARQPARPVGRYVDSICLIGVTDHRYPHLVHARTVERGGHPHVMLPTLRRIWAANGHDSALLAALLLANDWSYLDPGTATTHGNVAARRLIAGIGLVHAASGQDGADVEPEPVAVVPLTTVGELDAAWLYLLDPAEDTVTVHTGDGHPIGRHRLEH
ncbi:hypothetical protein ABZS66_31570 [Dactylosporangium sp. NPDC005572]|uniref:hypothetical protein n=1 Tax=Dactylosporangium sp. NPDC005572 TaxID=3156889 RepID=UPI00339EC737